MSCLVQYCSEDIFPCLTERGVELDYVRFSALSYSEIAAMYNIHSSSNESISAMFSTALLNAIGTNLTGQQIMDCKNVSRLDLPPKVLL